MNETLLQLEAPISTFSLLVTAIATLSTVVGFLFVYSSKLNKIIKTQAETYSKHMKEQSEVYSKQSLEFYRESTKDYKDTIQKSTEAFIQHSESIKMNTETVRESSLETTKALSDLREFLLKNIK